MSATQANAASKPSVQTYTDEAVPMEPPAAQAFQNAPLAAGTLSMDDVLKAHQPKKKAEANPVVEEVSIPAATGLMMTQGMNAVFQKHGIASAPAKTTATISTPKFNQAETKQASAPAEQALAASAPPTEKASAAHAYEPGREPKPLAGAPSQPETQAQAKLEQSCAESVQKWEKSCSDAGYPASFEGKVSGETRTGCTDGTLQDVWVTNTCAPPGEAPQEAKVADATPPTAETAYPQNNVHFLKPPASEPLPATEVAAKAPPQEPPELPALALAKEPSPPSHSLVKPPESSLPAPASAKAPEAPEAEAEAAPAPGKDHIAALIEASDVPEAKKSAPAPVPAPATTHPEELCGEASEILAYEAPKKNLCRVGSASDVKGKGPWTWSCTDNSGAVSSCKTLSLNGDASESAEMPATPASASAPSAASASRAPTSAAAKARFLQLPSKTGAARPSSVAAVEPQPALPAPVCGTASGQTARVAPEQNLCEAGKASAVRGANPWRWTCSSGKEKVSCGTIKVVDGVCGTANGKSVAAQPSGNLCKKGTASAVSGEGPWTWACKGEGGNDASCSAEISKTAEIPLLKEKPTPIPAAKRIDPPSPTPIPEAIEITADAAPAEPPKLEDTTPVPPPPVRNTLPTAPSLQKEAEIPAVSASGKTFILDPTLSAVLFSHLSEGVEKSSRGTLDKLATALNKHPTARISLIAYAEGAGLAPRAVHRLSLTRALAVKSYLSSKGIAESRMDVHAEGASAPTGYPDRVDVKVND
jgi:outer membrane protein OmpA-like peptidoglycan-associated protein